MQYKLHIYAITALLHKYEYKQYKLYKYEIVKNLTHYKLIIVNNLFTISLYVVHI